MTWNKPFVAALAFAIASIAVETRPVVKGPEHGTLVIVGGGKLVPEILARFFELAGGKDAPVVVIPTAGGGRDRRMGAAAGGRG